VNKDRVQRRAVLNAVMNLMIPYKTWKFLTSWATVSFSRRALLHGEVGL
jgi:hypothetical protein